MSVQKDKKVLSSAFAELVVDSEKDKQISGNGEGVEKKVVEINSNIGASGKEVKLGEKAEHEQDITEAVLVLEQIQIDEKTFLDQKKEKLIVEKTGEISIRRCQMERIETGCW